MRFRDQLKTLEETVKNNQTVDWDKLTADFETKQKAYVDEQIQAKLRHTPGAGARPGALIGENGVKLDKSKPLLFRSLVAFEKDGLREVRPAQAGARRSVSWPTS